MSENGRPAIYRRRFLIYPKFQLALIAVNIVTMMAVFGAIQFQILVAVGEMQGLVDAANLSPNHRYNRFIEYQMSVIYSGLFLYLVIAFVISCGFTLFISHRLAGPLYRMQQYFSELEEKGEIHQPLKFRKGDYFQGLPEAVNKGLDSIKSGNDSAGSS